MDGEQRIESPGANDDGESMAVGGAERGDSPDTQQILAQ